MPAVQAVPTVAHGPTKAHSLMPYLLEEKHLVAAARACMRRAAAPGADGITWKLYRQGLRPRLADLAGRLADGSWTPGPTLHVTLTTFAGKEFAAVVPTVEDRIVHRALRGALDPVLDRALADWASAYRPGRNRVTAVRQAAAHVAAGFGWVADVDVADSSAGGDTEEFVDRLAELVADGPFLAVFRAAIDGLPSPLVPGSGLWPVLFHLRMNQVDQRLADLRVVRFADNYAAFAADRAGATSAFERVRSALAAAGLRPNPRKSTVRPPHRANPEDLFLLDG